MSQRKNEAVGVGGWDGGGGGVWEGSWGRHHLSNAHQEREQERKQMDGSGLVNIWGLLQAEEVTGADVGGSQGSGSPGRVLEPKGSSRTCLISGRLSTK